LKKSSITWNTVLVFLSGGLLLYVLSRLFRKKTSQSNSTQSEGLTFSPTPTKSQLTYQEIFDWLRLRENVTYTAKRDGQDSKGNPKFSIGMGHQIQPGEEYLFNTTISEQKVRELFKKDIEEITKDVEKSVFVPLNRNQKLALISIRYNVGTGGFKSGKLLSTLNTGNYAGAAAIIPTFIVTSNGGIFNLGLQNRRKLEQALFVKAN
jgi:GH24 family phage-related lysozyme (muramidase)